MEVLILILNTKVTTMLISTALSMSNLDQTSSLKLETHTELSTELIGLGDIILLSGILILT